MSLTYTLKTRCTYLFYNTKGGCLYAFCYPGQKMYAHRDDGNNTLEYYGVFHIDAVSPEETWLRAEDLMSRRMVQSIDPRIAWDDDYDLDALSHAGYVYVDWSLQIDREEMKP